MPEGLEDLMGMHIPFLWQMLVGEIIYAMGYQKREHHVCRLVTAFLAETAAAVFVCYFLAEIPAESFETAFLQMMLGFCITFLMSLAGVVYCWRESVQAAVFCTITSYAVQHLVSQICLTSFDMIRYNRASWMIGIQIFLFGSAYGICYIIQRRKCSRGVRSALLNRNVFGLSAVTLAVTLVLSSARDLLQYESQNLEIITRLFSMVCCSFILILRSGLLERSQLEQEMEMLQNLHYQERKQYEQSRENIDLINIKCHDMKRRLKQYEQKEGRITQEELRELKQGIAIYDRTVKTGNETLDTILTEQSLICEKNGIIFSCIVDGEGLGFLSIGDVYSLFGNIVENAISAVTKLEKREERVISLSVRQKMGMLVISEENPYVEKLHFLDGLPVTTKKEKRYHGYGMKSIRMIVQKYGGELIVTADEMFHLTILFPMVQK